jgi:tripartite-type tricarboxylate transporter receptor subunit TctC
MNLMKLFVTVSILLFSTSALALTLIVPYPPGGSPDIAARRLAEYFARQEIITVVQNISGAESIIGTNRVSQSPADGSVLYVVTSTVNLKIAERSPQLDPRAQDIKPVALFARTPLFFVVREDSTINSLSDLRDQMNLKKVPAVFASSGGILEMMMKRVSTYLDIQDLIYVPYRGTPAGLIDVIGGSATVSMINGLEATEPYLKSRKLKVIAVGSEKRNALLPNVPTVSETFPGETFALYIGVLAPPGTSDEIIQKYNKLINQYLSEPDIRRTMNNYYEVQNLTPDEFGKLINKEISPYITK